MLSIAFAVFLGLVLFITAPIWIPLLASLGCLAVVLFVVVLGFVAFDIAAADAFFLLGAFLAYVVIKDKYQDLKETKKPTSTKGSWEGSVSAREARQVNWDSASLGRSLGLIRFLGLSGFFQYLQTLCRPRISDVQKIERKKTLQGLLEEAKQRESVYLDRLDTEIEHRRQAAQEKLAQKLRTTRNFISSEIRSKLTPFIDEKLVSLLNDEEGAVLVRDRKQVLICKIAIHESDSQFGSGEVVVKVESGIGEVKTVSPRQAVKSCLQQVRKATL